MKIEPLNPNWSILLPTDNKSPITPKARRNTRTKYTRRDQAINTTLTRRANGDIEQSYQRFRQRCGNRYQISRMQRRVAVVWFPNPGYVNELARCASLTRSPQLSSAVRVLVSRNVPAFVSRFRAAGVITKRCNLSTTQFSMSRNFQGICIYIRDSVQRSSAWIVEGLLRILFMLPSYLG